MHVATIKVEILSVVLSINNNVKCNYDKENKWNHFALPTEKYTVHSAQ